MVKSYENSVREIKDLSDIYDLATEENNKVIGTITNFHKKNQPILFCDINNKEIMIPYTKEIIHRVDNFKKEIHVIIPKGLLDLN